MTEPRIQRATEADLAAIANLAAVIWREHYPGIISREQVEYMLARMYSHETLRDEIQSKGIHFEQLLVNEQLAGFASFGPTNNPNELKLHKLYLHPSLQGRGMGSHLLQHCAREAAQLGAHRLILAVNKRNAKAIAAYQRNGFVIVQSVVTDIGGGFVMDDFLMAKDLKL